MKKPRIGIMVGSKSDLPQCFSGLVYLQNAQNKGQCEVVVVIVNSIHRNTEEVLENLRQYHDLDAWIIGAGWANHLTGTCDAFLRYTLKNTHIQVFGVAFSDKERDEHTVAADLSIKMVPGTQVRYDNYIGENGFLRACVDAIRCQSDLSPIKIGATKPVIKMWLEEAIREAK